MRAQQRGGRPRRGFVSRRSHTAATAAGLGGEGGGGGPPAKRGFRLAIQPVSRKTNITAGTGGQGDGGREG